MQIVWTRHYLIELASIGDYIGQHNPRAAARVVNEIHSKTARLLSANPFIGRVGEIKGTRELVIPGTPYYRCIPSEGNSDRNPFRPARREEMAGRGLSPRS